MSLIIRTWGCQNQACLSHFDSDKAYPSCPRCGCVRVGWVPGKVNIGSEATRHNDRTLRDLAQAYGLTDLASAREGEPAKKMTPAPSGGAGVMNFGGFAANIDPSRGAQCLPTVNRIDAKVRPGLEQKMSGQLGLPSIARPAR